MPSPFFVLGAEVLRFLHRATFSLRKWRGPLSAKSVKEPIQILQIGIFFESIKYIIFILVVEVSLLYFLGV